MAAMTGPAWPPPFDPGTSIGALPCSNCRRRLAEHCRIHLVRCCPGRCPGPSPVQRLAAAPPPVPDPDEWIYQ